MRGVQYWSPSNTQPHRAKRMNIELKNVKFAAFASQETNCFRATLYINGKARGEVSNEGHGGCHDYSDRTAEQELTAHAKTMPKRTLEGSDFEYQPDADSLIDDLFTAAIVLKDYTRAIKSAVVFTRKGKTGIFKTKKLDPKVMASALADPAKFFPDADKVLNLLPQAEALAIWKAA